MLHGIVVTQPSFAAKETEVWKVRQAGDPGARQSGDVPEEARPEEPVETGKIGQATVGERAIEEQMIRFRVRAHERVLDRAAMPRLEDRQLMKQRQRRVGDAAAGLEAVELPLAGERRDQAVAGMRAEQVDALQMVAVFEVRNATVGNTALPAHLKSLQLSKVAQDIEPAIGNAAARILTEIELL